MASAVAPGSKLMEQRATAYTAPQEAERVFVRWQHLMLQLQGGGLPSVCMNLLNCNGPWPW